MKPNEYQENKKEKKINTQIKTTEDLHYQLKEYAEQRSIPIQAAGVEALEFWIEIQKEFGSYFPSNDPVELGNNIKQAFIESIRSWSKTKRKEKFKGDTFQNIIGMTSGDKNLSIKHNRQYTGEDS